MIALRLNSINVKSEFQTRTYTGLGYNVFLHIYGQFYSTNNTISRTTVQKFLEEELEDA